MRCDAALGSIKYEIVFDIITHLISVIPLAVTLWLFLCHCSSPEKH